MADPLFDIDANIEGLDEVIVRLDKITVATRGKVGRFALRKAANIVRDAAIAGAQKVDRAHTPEQIAANIVVRWSGRKARRTGDIPFRVGVMGGARGKSAKEKNSANPGGDTFYWRFLEFGTSKMKAQPFMRDALANNVQKAIDEFQVQYIKSLARFTKRGIT